MNKPYSADAAVADYDNRHFQKDDLEAEKADQRESRVCARAEEMLRTPNELVDVLDAFRDNDAAVIDLSLWLEAYQKNEDTRINIQDFLQKLYFEACKLAEKQERKV